MAIKIRKPMDPFIISLYKYLIALQKDCRVASHLAALTQGTNIVVPNYWKLGLVIVGDKSAMES